MHATRLIAALVGGSCALSACASLLALDDVGYLSPDATAPDGPSVAEAMPRDEAGAEAGPPNDGARVSDANPLCYGHDLAGPIAACADAAAGRVCIDLTETTNDDYAAFIDAMADDDARAKVSAGLPPPCAPFVSAAGVNPSVPIPADRPCNPVTSVNWCQAHAYCRSVGKRMCGAIGDGGLMRQAAQALDPGTSEWAFMCTGGSGRNFP